MIKMISGTFGYWDGVKVVPKTNKDAPFSAGAECEARLVRLGIAEYVGGASKPAEELPELPDGVEAIPEYDVNMKADELRKIAKLMGLTFAVGTTKAEMVAQMDAFLDEHMEDAEDDVDMPPEDIDDAPAFDATEAVQ